MIKPCPYCNGIAEVSIPPYADDTDTMVICTGCDACGPSFQLGLYQEGVDNAIEQWNAGIDIDPPTQSSNIKSKVK